MSGRGSAPSSTAGSTAGPLRTAWIGAACVLAAAAMLGVATATAAPPDLVPSAPPQNVPDQPPAPLDPGVQPAAEAESGPQDLAPEATKLVEQAPVPREPQVADEPAAETEDSGAEQVLTEGEAKREKLMNVSCRGADDRPVSWLDRTHSYLNQHLCEPAAWFDGFFGDDRALEETPVGTFFRLRSEVRWDQDENFRVRLRLSANISLPGASEKLRLLLTRDEDVRGEFEPYLPVTEGEKQTRIGFRYNLSERMRSRLDTDATVRVNTNSLNPVLRARYRQAEQLTDNSFGRFTQVAFWEADQGFGTTSRADWEWFHDYDTQIRLSGQGTWSEQSNGVDWRSSITGFRQLDPKTAIRTELGAFGWTDPEFETEEIYLNFRYRRSFLRPWLFYELQPERAWVIDDTSGNRRGDWRFIVTFEAQFENQPAREEREQHNLKRWADWLNRQIRERPDDTTPANPAPADEGRMNM